MSWIIALIAAYGGGVIIGIIMEPMTLVEFYLAGSLGFGWGFICAIIRSAIMRPWPNN